MQKEKKDKHFIKKPFYEGGPKAMKAFVKENLKYPEQALKAKVEGPVKVRYSIDYKGNVVDTKVIAGLGHGCDEEAQRIVKLFKFQVPKNRKVKVLFYKNITIHFRLPKKVEKPKTSIQYNVTKHKKTPKEDEGKKGGGYTYTIEF
ncbi:MAG: energy transducer TonB [Bacteroidetes bacterium]|nr:MAG: energy transducer TonB [Bacteroidota bacterium]